MTETASGARAALLRQMAALRRRLDPRVVERLRLARDGKVPYDREAAEEAVRLFLAGRSDSGRFKTRLAKALRDGDPKA